VALGFRRLSILDLGPGGHQPMSTADGRWHIVFNGEIYNYVELRRELQALGRTFRTRSDTEVLLAAWAEWGPAALRRLVGMFAFAVLDLRDRRLTLARDFFAIKPLYWTAWADGLAFASEIKALLALPGVGRTVNPGRLYEYLRFGVADHGDETLFGAIRAVPGAHFLEFPLDRPGEAKPVRYWAPDLRARSDLGPDEAARRLRELFLESVRLHLRSDVPVGAALSGGIDSSAIVAAMREVQGKSLDIHTFTYVADDPALSEERWADLAGRAAGATMHKTRPDPHELVADLDRLIDVQEEPFASTSIYAQHRVFRLAREAGIPVMLDGQGADELLGGYRFYLGVRMASLLRQGRLLEASRFLKHAGRLPGSAVRNVLFYTSAFLAPLRLRPALMRLSGQGPAPRGLNRAWFAARGVRPGGPISFADARGLRGQLAWSLTGVGLPELLRYEDRNSMAFSIESRVPFLTPAMAELVLSLPEEYLIAADGTTKSVFRRAMRGLVPDQVLDRRDKVGFVTTEQQWLEDLRPWVEETLGAGAREVPALDAGAVAAEWAAVLARRKRFDFRIWRWINLVRWARRFQVSFAE